MNYLHQPRCLRQATVDFCFPRRTAPLGGFVFLVVALAAARSFGQAAAPDTAVIDTIRTETQISESDQRRIGDWVEGQVAALKGIPEAQRGDAAIKFRDLMRAQYENPSNTPAFKEQFAAKLAAALAAQVASLDPITGRALAKVMLDSNRPELVPAYLAALKSKDAGVRMLGAAALAGQRVAIAADKAKLDQVVAAIRDVGAAETNGVVLSRMYYALSVPPAQAPSVFDAFMAIFEKRLEKKRQGGTACDGAEVMAFEFFRTPGVLAALSQPQKEQIVRAVGEFMRYDAQRYDKSLPFQELDRLQRELDGAEEIISSIASGVKGGDVRGALASGAGGDQISQQVQLWVGDPKTKQPGALNAAPWNVPLGAP